MVISLPIGLHINFTAGIDGKQTYIHRLALHYSVLIRNHRQQAAMAQGHFFPGVYHVFCHGISVNRKGVTVTIFNPMRT